MLVSTKEKNKMADTDVNKTPETGSQPQVSNDTSPVAAPVQDNSNAELELLRKEKEQAEMRANQLANQLSEKLKAENEAQTKKLEEEGKLKEALTLERAEKQKLIDEKDATERTTLLNKETSEVLTKYSPAVVDIAQTAGLSLVDDSDEAKTDLIKKLDDIAAKVGGRAKVVGNNPPNSTPQAQPKEELLGVMSDPTRRPRERDAAGMKFISGLETIKAMKEAAGYTSPTE
jgi:hypothetical protein